MFIQREVYFLKKHSMKFVYVVLVLGLLGGGLFWYFALQEHAVTTESDAVGEHTMPDGTLMKNDAPVMVPE
jgi:hypothetical protein